METTPSAQSGLPDQPRNRELGSAWTVRVTSTPSGYSQAHSVPQSMLPASADRAPSPVPLFDTVSGWRPFTSINCSRSSPCSADRPGPHAANEDEE